MTADPGLQATERFMCILLSVCSVTLGVAKALTASEMAAYCPKTDHL